jgi:hypothetical protein
MGRPAETCDGCIANAMSVLETVSADNARACRKTRNVDAEAKRPAQERASIADLQKT